MQILVAIIYNNAGDSRVNLGVYDSPHLLLADLDRQQYSLEDRGENFFDLVMESARANDIFCSEKLVMRRNNRMTNCREAFKQAQEDLLAEENLSRYRR